MNAHKSPIGTVHSPQVPVASVPAHPLTGTEAFLITADASKVSGRDFFDAITGRSPAIRAAEREQTIQRCIRAIERGDTYGFPPMLVDECREIMAGESGWALAERSAYGMGAK